ncbi:MAG: DEAD/DEAH box helicase [Candidatus Neomarinimicrobiota bacterium]
MVHEDFGIGLYRGLTTVGAPGAKQECVSILYKGGDLVHVPFHRLGRVHPYVGSSTKPPPLSSLASTKWQRFKQQTRRSAEKVVDEFINLYALRHKSKGYSFSQDAELHAELKQSFPYTETGDQIRAYANVCEDMEASKPMDRLICGDVGFGKTEVALRAALKAAYDNKQVAVLTPTTILANQHYITFTARLDPLGVRVAFLSRFTPPAQARETVRHLGLGQVDVLVGTHRLLSPDIEFADLGLVIVDEEHRFGARQKEKLKTLRTEVDVLTMTATPIPRTLQFSLLGIRDVSSIMTPPRERLPIVTKLVTFSEDTVQRGVMAEIQRGGQVFFVNDNVKTIDDLRTRLERLLPSLSLGVAHGQLPGRQLEKTMVGFLGRKLDVLICTTIIESGIDLPNVNTIFVNNAHRFGLSQIHQIRGRVGRSDKQAFCYLLIPHDRKLTAAALDRLRTIEYHSSLGSGYALALKDLEMRGAGNLFGVEQSGHISSVGFYLFCKIVEEAANQRLQKDSPELVPPTADVSFSGSAMIPTSYVSEVGDRLHFYRRLSSAKNREELADVAEEMKDRYGPYPPPTDNLLTVAALQLKAKERSVTRLTISRQGIRAHLAPWEERKALLAYVENVRTRFDALGCPLEFTHDSKGGLEIIISKDSKDPAHGLKLAQYLFESSPDYSNFR